MRADPSFVVSTGAGPIAGWAKGAGLDLLLLHGGPGISDYADLLRAETKAWHVIHHQQRGLPPSSPEGPFTVEQHVEDAIAVLDHLGVERLVVLGHSWGGSLAWLLALAQPERVTGLVVIEGLGATGDGGDRAMGAELERRLDPGLAEQWHQVSTRLEGPSPTDQDALSSLRLLWPGYFADPAQAPEPPADLRVSVTCNVETKASLLDAMADDGLAGRLRGLEVPTVVMTGERSPLAASAGEELAALLPRAELQVVPAAGHLVWHEQPGSVGRALAHVAERARV